LFIPDKVLWRVGAQGFWDGQVIAIILEAPEGLFLRLFLRRV
jgi:hypothetical protein